MREGGWEGVWEDYERIGRVEEKEEEEEEEEEGKGERNKTGKEAEVYC